jgi:hypothetical protein
MVLLIFLKLSS